MIKSFSGEIPNFIFKLLVSVLLSMQVSLAFLHVEGGRIVDSTGNDVVLRGIGLGGWLVPEGYMFRLPGYGSPTSIRNQIISLIGEEETDRFFRVFRENYITREDVRKIAEMGFNSIRLPMDYKLLTPPDSPGVYLEEGFGYIDSILSWCEENEMYLILDMHCAPGGQNSDNISDSNGSAELWLNPSNQDRTEEIWREIASRYADRQWIGGYDLLNEPVLPSGISAGDLRNFYMRLREAIREVDSNHIIFIEGNWYATDFTMLSPPFDNNMVYAFHKYWSKPDRASLQSYINMSNQYRVPLWLGEFGENSNPWYRAVIDLCESEKIGWNWWTYKKISTINGIYNIEPTEDYQRIIDFLDGSGSKPSEEFCKTTLFEMADRFRSERAEFKKDVVYSLFGEGFTEHPVPFADNKIPGVISAVDFDLGNEGVAYHDNNFERDSFQNWTAWNSGWSYRNDGVDIEATEDGDLPGYNIGWTEPGEWLRYTLTAEISGSYTIRVQYSSETGGGLIRIYLGEEQLDFSCPATGGWQIWEMANIGKMYIDRGTQDLRVEILQSGINLRSFRFLLNPDSNFQEISPKILLGRVYPNPFNRITNIPIVINDPETVRVEIFSGNGSNVVTLFDGKMESGYHRLSWNGTDREGKRAGSGVYFYKVYTDHKVKTGKMLLIK